MFSVSVRIEKEVLSTYQTTLLRGGTIVRTYRTRRAHYLVRRIVDFLYRNEDGYQIRMMRLQGNTKIRKKYKINSTRICGLIDPSSRLIFVDFRYDPIATIVHEALHALYPNKRERDIAKMERLVMRYITEAQVVIIWTLAERCMRAT